VRANGSMRNGFITGPELDVTMVRDNRGR